MASARVAPQSPLGRVKFTPAISDTRSTNRPRRLIAIVAVGAGVLAGTAAFSERREAALARDEACQTTGELHDATSVRLTKAQRTEALTIAASDPLVQRLWGGSAPSTAAAPHGPGLFVFPTPLVLDRGILGTTTQSSSPNIWASARSANR